MKRLLLFLTIFGASFLILKAQTITWTGVGDGTNWSDANNWDLTTIPTVTHDVIIPDGSSLTINVSAIAKSLDLQGNSTLSIIDNFTFEDKSLFGSNSIVNWYSGGFWSGDLGPNANICSITNKGTINVLSSPTGLAYCKLDNEGLINISATGALWLLTRGELNNLQTGVIDMQDECDILPMIPIPGYFTIGALNNYGLIKRDIGIGFADIMVPTNNYGTIEVLSGTLRFSNFELNNTINGVIKGYAFIELPTTASFINNGVIEPGSSTGASTAILLIIGDFTSSATSKLVIELDGLRPIFEHDLLVIQGNAIFNGIVDVTMGFEGNINDEFIVVTTTGTITECSLESTATGIFDGIQYNFDVKCRNNNEVVLKIVDKTLDVGTNELADAKILLFPNPTIDIITIKNDSELNLQTATIFDLSGRILATVDLNGMGRFKDFSLQNLKSGHYFVKINSDFGNVIRRFIKL